VVELAPWRAISCAMASAFCPARSEVRTGGRRTTSPASTRVSACALPLFTLTSPLRMMR
jgi:hypothetical protein